MLQLETGGGSWYSDWLREERKRGRSSSPDKNKNFLHVVQTGSGDPQAFCAVGTGSSSPETERPGREADHISNYYQGQEYVAPWGASIISGTGDAICKAVLVALCNGRELVCKISRSWIHVLIFKSFYLESCVWPGVISRWIRQRNSITFWANPGENAMETVEMIRQAFGKETMRRTQKVQTHRDRKGRDMWRAKSRTSHHFDNKGTVHKEFALAGRTANSSYYCDVLLQLRESVRRFRPELWHHDKAPSHTSFFSYQGTYYQKQYDFRPPTTLISSFPRLKIKLKGRHFDTTDVIETK
jgi:hypothetical protein